MGKFKDLTGQKFGKLTVVGLTGTTNKDKRLLYNASCECGTSLEVSGKYLTDGDTTSCGCVKRELLIERNTLHNKSHTREYQIWLGVKKRCLDSNHPNYLNYGAKGVNISKTWLNDFDKFLEDMGKAPSDEYTIERIENSKGYCSDNCKWVLRKEQSLNKGMYKNNKSGHTGVFSRGNSFVCYWNNETGRKSKSFNVNKYGEEFAFFAACEYRDQMINLLRLLGFNYSFDHGKQIEPKRRSYETILNNIY